MRWKNKARTMTFCSRMPAGDRIYKTIQKVFGRLRAEPMARLPTQAEMYSWLEKEEVGVAGKHFFEVGTGHVPLAPIGFFLCGAATVITVDLHQRIDWGLTRKSLEWIAANRESVVSLYDNKEGIAERLAILSRFQHEPVKFFKEANIQYLAPKDATNTGLPDNSIDCHFSITVLEHIPLSTIRDIFQEAKRILKPNGVAVHFIDMSDHFQHTDKSITRINFLQYSDTEWKRIAGNEFAYCNRLRASDYLKLFEDCGYTILRQSINKDPESMEQLSKNRIVLDKKFSVYEIDDVCSTALRVLLR